MCTLLFIMFSLAFLAVIARRACDSLVGFDGQTGCDPSGVRKSAQAPQVTHATQVTHK